MFCNIDVCLMKDEVRIRTGIFQTWGTIEMELEVYKLAGCVVRGLVLLCTRIAVEVGILLI